jgi:hypothetical protein
LHIAENERKNKNGCKINNLSNCYAILSIIHIYIYIYMEKTKCPDEVIAQITSGRKKITSILHKNIDSELLKMYIYSWVPVTHTYSPSYLGG